MYMNRLWILYEMYMDVYESLMDFIWIHYKMYMDSLWILYEMYIKT